MDSDDLAKQQSDRIFQVRIQNMLGNSSENLVGKLASRHCPGSIPITASRLPNGAFNICYRVTFENGYRVMVRFVGLGRVIALNEKVKDELIVTLSLGISIPILRRAYSDIAEILLELSKPEFPKLGPLNKIIFERGRFSSAADYFEELARYQFFYLELQRNNIVTDKFDYRKKYIARCLFRKLSREISKKHCRGPFRLYCDDLRPENVLVDISGLTVTSVVNWEYTYAAYVKFTLTAP
ncbi:Aminoglycoside phosphotransferase [Penicillium maclennaniae]|uniref:Aminoglycoside phosphotransferase n=1 Tax=Penicillium maclennaniae TaxID=1343394 RepID=UPI002541BCDB|nr:Aminoglycoside phosphotransferase [Penicillium maclennaniae]KAJ5661878.1 Aminoglycoside phosphotransferase [Penicillium maclennaniae]